MALSPSDPYYRAEVVPPSISAMRAPLCAAFGVGADAFGDKGNLVHASGYHRSRDWILHSPDSRYGLRDYSVQLTVDRQGDAAWVSAFDFTPGVWGTPDNRAKMVKITERVLAAAERYDPRLADLREFAGTIDGSNVITFYCQGGGLKDPFDSSHLDHCHGSFYRGRAANDHAGIVDIMLGAPAAQEEDEAMSIEIGPDCTNIGVPGGAGRRRYALQITNDLGFGLAAADAPQAYALRCYAKPYGGAWVALDKADVLSGGHAPDAFQPGGLVRLAGGETLSWKLPDDTRVVSVRRMAIGGAGHIVAPVPGDPMAQAYAGPLAGALEPLATA